MKGLLEIVRQLYMEFLYRKLNKRHKPKPVANLLTTCPCIIYKLSDFNKRMTFWWHNFLYNKLSGLENQLKLIWESGTKMICALKLIHLIRDVWNFFLYIFRNSVFGKFWIYVPIEKWGKTKSFIDQNGLMKILLLLLLPTYFS